MYITRKWTDKLENTFSKILNTFLASEFHIQLHSSVIKTITLEYLKNVSEGYQ